MMSLCLTKTMGQWPLVCTLLLLLCATCRAMEKVKEMEQSNKEKPPEKFCSFFNNRKPSPQPGLRNCTWFRPNSCCKQEEIDATFGTVKPLAGSSPECQRYTNYLMCYICAPYQNFFYGQERLTVCEEFCNAWYTACSSSILKGSVIGALYKSGREFCLKRNFQCEPAVNVEAINAINCFTVPLNIDLSNGAGARVSPDGNTFILRVFSIITAFVVGQYGSRTAGVLSIQETVSWR